MSAGSDDSTLLTPRNLGAFLLVSVIWGGTWLVIKDQLGNVPAQWSITYRFVVACLGMFALAKLRGESLALAKGGQRWALLLGITYVGLAGAWKDWNDHTYTAYNRFLRTVPQTITGLAAVAAFVSGHRFTCDWWELLRAASAMGASVMVVVAAAAAHGNAHGAEPQLCFHPGCHSPTLFAIWGAVWLAISAVLTPNVRVFISDHTGLGMRVVGLEFLLVRVLDEVVVGFRDALELANHGVFFRVIWRSSSRACGRRRRRRDRRDRSD